MSAHTVLVIGADEEARPLVAALRVAGFDAWPDQMERAASDCVSFEWADAVVIIDTCEQEASRNPRPLAQFRGPAILMTSVGMSGPERACLLDDGFDAVLDSPDQRATVVARLRRLLGPRARVASGTRARCPAHFARARC